VKSFSALKGSYTKIPNELLNDPTLSWKAKGLFCYMASKPDAFNFTSRSLAKQFKDGKAAILSAMDELKDKGWINYIRHPNGTGKYSLNTTLKPTLTPQPDNQTEQEPDPDYQTEPDPDYQDPENRSFRKSGRINKKDLNNNKDIYKGNKEKAKAKATIVEIEPVVELEPIDGDQFGSSTRYSEKEMLEMLLTGVIDVH
jgi:hypothetical protein